MFIFHGLFVSLHRYSESEMSNPRQSEIKNAARKFAAEWKNRGKEDKDYTEFWEDLLEDVFGVPKARKEIEPQSKVKFEGSTKRIDIRIKTSKIVVEQKSNDVDLDVKQKQSGKDSNGNEIWLTPMEQAIRYYNNLDTPDQGRYVIACNFKEFRIWDSYHKNAPVKSIMLEELPSRWRDLKILVEPYRPEGFVDEKREERVSSTASEFIRNLYDTIYASKKEWTKSELQSLNMFCVRVVFCLFAEDAGIFDDGQFRTFLEKFNARDLSKKFDALYFWLDMTEARRREYYKLADVEVQQFPYVDGGLFNNADLYETPAISKAAYEILKSAWDLKLKDTDETFDWSEISPTNFGCIFESTVDSEVRESGGMHYTTPSNIHRVIDPLFMDDLKEELGRILALPIDTKGQKDVKYARLEAFRDRLSSMRFLDPACGSGNFLTETYKSLHALELSAIESELEFRHNAIMANQDPCKVRMGQFFGIEIDHFAASVARASLWIAECQLIQETKKVLHCQIDPLPLEKNTNVIQADALLVDWNEVLKRKSTTETYIIGNPPFQGAKKMNDEQKKSLQIAMPSRLPDKTKLWDKQGKFDFVCAWYAKAAAYMEGKRNITAAFVSTNSIVQGDQEAPLWHPLMSHYNLQILFAWQSFEWFNEADNMAHVYCVIVGFYLSKRKRPIEHRIFSENRETIIADNINGYLLNAENLFVWNRGKALCKIPDIVIGNKPIDGGNYLFTKQEMDEFIEKEPQSAYFFHPWYGSEEFISRQPRYCLWLGDCTPAELAEMPFCVKRVEAVKAYRKECGYDESTDLYKKPRRFHVEFRPESEYIIIPSTSSKNREYVPMGFMHPNNMASNAVMVIADASLYTFGVLESRIHMAWMRIVCGRLKEDYRYTKGIVYNNFPWPDVTDEQKATIEATARTILGVREKYADSTLEQLYKPALMPDDLIDAHTANDKAVAAIYAGYGINLNMSDEEIAIILMRVCTRLAAPKPKKRKKPKRQNPTKKSTK